MLRSLCDAAQDHRERARIDRSERTVCGVGDGQLEERLVQSLVEQAVAIVLFEFTRDHSSDAVSCGPSS